MLNFLRLRSIKDKLAIAFLSVLGVAVLMGALGTLGNMLTGLELRKIGQVDLPNTERATRIERLAAELEMMVVTYQTQPYQDPSRIEEIHRASDKLQAELQAAEMPTLAASHLKVKEAIDASLQTHESLGAFHFTFGKDRFVLSSFLNFLAIENKKLLQKLIDASRLGAFGSINTDPERTIFNRWRHDFSQDVGLEMYIDNYAAREAEFLSYVASGIIGDPQNSEANIPRMIAQRVPALDKALKTLATAAAKREVELAMENDAQVAVIRDVLSSFVNEVHQEQLASARAMHESIEHGKNLGITIAYVSSSVFLLGLGITISSMIWTRRFIGAPLGQLADTLWRLSQNDDAINVPHRDRSDEIGEVANAAEDFRLALIRQRELEVQASAEREAVEVARLMAEEKTREADQARNEAEEARNFHAKKSAVAQAFFVAFSRIVEQAEQGQFEERIGIRFDDEDYDSLSEAVNRMMDSIEGSLWETGQVIGDLAAGRLNTRMSGDSVGAFAALKKDVNATADRLRSVVQSISETSIAVSTDTGSLSRNSDILAQRSMAQASSIEQTNQSLTQVAEMITSNASGAEKVAEQANGAATQARSGQKVVSDAIRAMADIEDSGRRVSEIVDVIGDISFQTNLLALNAGVEAARAGEAGKGFMVVAQEVRQLAQRASDAGRDIGTLIVQSTTDVEKGVTLVRSAGEVLDGIVNAISVVETAAAEITQFSREQENSIRGVTAVMQDLDRTTQENAGAAERTADAVKRLNEQTGELEKLLDFFRDQEGKLKDGGNLCRPVKESDWARNGGPEKRAEPHVGASLSWSGKDPGSNGAVSDRNSGEWPKRMTAAE